MQGDLRNLHNCCRPNNYKKVAVHYNQDVAVDYTDSNHNFVELDHFENLNGFVEIFAAPVDLERLEEAVAFGRRMLENLKMASINDSGLVFTSFLKKKPFFINTILFKSSFYRYLLKHIPK